MNSPIGALLWEIWRLTRTETVWRLALGIAGGLAALVVFAAIAPNETVKDFGAVIAMMLLVLPHFTGWVSLAWRVGGRAGFPLRLLYTRPLRTPIIVGFLMAYLTAVSAAMYLVSALLLRATSGYPFPLLPVAAWIAALNLVLLATQWSNRNRIVQTLVAMVASVAWFNLAVQRLTAKEIPGFDWPPNLWPTLFDFPLTDYALIGAIALASFGAAVAGVARQRHGDAPTPRAVGSAGFPEWLVNLFRFPCPTSSAMRAQIWFDLKSRGLPVLTIGVVLAIVNPLVFALSVPFESARTLAVMCGVFSVVTVLVLAGNAFGIRWKASVLETTQPSGTARLAGLKVLVRSVCILVALVAVSVSVWASLSFIALGERYEPLRSWQHAIEGAVEVLTGYQLVALAVVASIGVVVMVTSLAAFRALAARYRRGMNIVGALLLLHGLALVLLALNGYRGVGSKFLWEFLLDALAGVARWIDAPAIVLATVYVSWRVFAERLLTLRQAVFAVLISAAFGVAWVTLLYAAGVQLAEMSATNAVWILSPLLLPLMASALAPWSFNRVRHV